MGIGTAKFKLLVLKKHENAIFLKLNHTEEAKSSKPIKITIFYEFFLVLQIYCDMAIDCFHLLKMSRPSSSFFLENFSSLAGG